MAEKTKWDRVGWERYWFRFSISEVVSILRVLES